MLAICSIPTRFFHETISRPFSLLGVASGRGFGPGYHRVLDFAEWSRRRQRLNRTAIRHVGAGAGGGTGARTERPGGRCRNPPTRRNLSTRAAIGADPGRGGRRPARGHVLRSTRGAGRDRWFPLAH